MNRNAIWSLMLTAGAAGLGAPLAAQEGQPETEAARPAPEVAPEEAAEELVEKLGDPAYRVRRDAEKALRGLGDEARGALATAAEEHEDAEVRWRAQRLLRQLAAGDDAGDDAGQEPESGGTLRERSGRAQRAVRPPVPWGRPTRPEELDEMFEGLFERLETQFDMDIPRRSFFRDEFFQDLDEQMRKLRGGALKLDDFGRGVEGRSLQMQMGSDGVRVRVQERDDSGELQTRTYEAPDLETFRQKYPEVAERYLGGRDARAMNPFSRSGGVRVLPNTLRFTPRTPAPRTDDGPRLGVYVGELSPDVRAYLDLDSGLLVESVTPDSLAERLGIQAKDIVLDIEGKAVDSPAAVREALEGADETIDVTVHRRGKTVELRAVVR